jgi:hypothetical protein
MMKGRSGEYRVHYHRPFRRILLGLVLVPLLTVGGWALYQAGYTMGSDGESTARDEARDLQRRFSALERSHRQLLQRNARLERDQLIAEETARRVRESVGDMESRYRAMEEELTFYRSIVSPEDMESGLHIFSLDLEPVGRDGEYVYRVVLTQIRGGGTVEGTLELALVGRQGASRVELQGTELGEELQGSQGFGFRYFQNLEGRIRVPAGVTPRSVRVVARTEGDSPRQVEQDYAWDAALSR